MTPGGPPPKGPSTSLRWIGLTLAVIVFLWSWVALGHGFFHRDWIVDTAVYQQYGADIHNGLVPYRDFSVEYPPGALPVFVAPMYIANGAEFNSYNHTFGWMMACFGLCCLAFTALGRAPARALAFIAVSPLLVGGALMLTRFDLWPTALVAGALAALVRDRHRVGWAALGAAFAVKIFAVVLIPLAIVWTLRRRGPAELRRGMIAWLAVVAVAFVPFAIVAPHGLWETLWGQFSRPMLIEGLVATFLTTFGRPNIIKSHDSLAIGGHGTLATLTTLVEIAALIWLWISFARGPVDRDRLVRYSAACVCAFIVFGKVLSPQYLIWLVPLVPLVRGLRGLAAIALLAAALVDTQWYFTITRYTNYINGFSHAPVILARNLLLVALFLVLSLPSRTRLRAP